MIRLHFRPPPLHPTSVRKLSLFVSLPVCRRSTYWRERGEGGGGCESQIIRPQESLGLHKSFHPLSPEAWNNPTYYKNKTSGPEPFFLNPDGVVSCNCYKTQQPIQYLIKVCCAQFRILMDPHRLLSAGCGSMKAKMIHKKERSEEIACFKVLDVLVSGVGASPLA